MRPTPRLEPGAHQQLSEVLAIDDEARVDGQVVVELAGRGIGMVGVPVHSLGTVRCGVPVQFFDQRASHATAARGFGGEQVLQVAGGADQDGVAVIEVMRQSQQPSTGFGHQRMHRFVGRMDA